MLGKQPQASNIRVTVVESTRESSTFQSGKRVQSTPQMNNWNLPMVEGGRERTLVQYRCHIPLTPFGVWSLNQQSAEALPKTTGFEFTHLSTFEKLCRKLLQRGHFHRAEEGGEVTRTPFRLLTSFLGQPRWCLSTWRSLIKRNTRCFPAAAPIFQHQHSFSYSCVSADCFSMTLPSHQLHRSLLWLVIIARCHHHCHSPANENQTNRFFMFLWWCHDLWLVSRLSSDTLGGETCVLAQISG